MKSSRVGQLTGDRCVTHDGYLACFSFYHHLGILCFLSPCGQWLGGWGYKRGTEQDTKNTPSHRPRSDSQNFHSYFIAELVKCKPGKCRELISIWTSLSAQWCIRLQFRRCNRCRSDPWVGKFAGEGNGHPLQYSRLENPMDGGPSGPQYMRLQRVGHDWAQCIQEYSWLFLVSSAADILTALESNSKHIGYHLLSP